LWKGLGSGTYGKGFVVSIQVQFIVENVPDVDRFISVMKKWQPTMAEEGASNQWIAVDENNSSTVGITAEWADHDTMHASSEKHGEDVNAELNMGDLNWITHLWHKK
jgi:hypothetical protein